MASESACPPRAAGRCLTAAGPRAESASRLQPAERVTTSSSLPNRCRNFPPECRIRKKKEFERVYSLGRQLYSKCFLISLAPAEVEQSRLGITVTLKIDKRAAVRNRIKRRIREIFRLNRHKLKKKLDIVIIARRGAPTCTYHEMERQILGALRHGGCFL